MKKYSKLMAILLVFAMILPGVAQAAPVVEAEEVNSNVIRLSGADRIKTSVKVSQTAYKDGAESVVIVGYEGEVDALAGTLLAHAKKGPVLFTKKGKLSEDTKTEIARLGAKNVYILGGTATIEDAVKTELETLKYTVKRISGSNREGTAAAVAKEVGGKTTHVFLARGYGDLRAVLSDALAVGPASAKGNMAVLLTRTDKVPAATLKSMKDLGVTNVTIVGGEVAVNSGVKTELETLKYTVDRLSGTTREGTAIAIANKYFAGKANALVANGYGSPDALVGGYLGAAIDAPILFSQANKVSEVTTDYLKANTEKAWILGGERVVNKEVLNKVLGAVVPTPTPPSTGGGSGDNVAVSAISVDKEATTLPVGTSETLVVTFDPTNATNKNVTWSSSDEGVATVADGVVTAVSEGTATITATSNNGKTATTTVTVVAANTVAMIGTTQYSSLRAAVDAANDSKAEVIMIADVTIAGGSGGYGVAGLVLNGAIINGNGNTLTVTGANNTWDAAIYTTGGTIKNLNIGGAFRGIFTASASDDIIIDNVVLDNVCYTFSSDGSNPNYSVIVTNSTLNGWTSFTSGYKSVSFNDCIFGKGTGGYQYAYMRPYSDTAFSNCAFSEGYELDATMTDDITLYNCTVGGVKLTQDNLTTLLGANAAKAKVLTIEDDVYYYGTTLYGLTNEFTGTTLTVREGTTVIGAGALQDNSTIAEVVLPDGLITIEANAFKRCTNLKTINLPNSLTSIGDQAFQQCSGLTSVVIPNNVTTIGYQAYNACRSVTELVIPEGVITIGIGAFRELAITEVTIPSTVKSLGSFAFRDCKQLRNVYFNCKSAPEITTNDSAKGQVFRVMDGSGNVVIKITKEDVYNDVTKEEYAFRGVYIDDSHHVSCVYTAQIAQGVLLTAPKTYEIISKAGLMNLDTVLGGADLGEGKAATVNLAADIDLTGETWTPISGMWFTFNGNGHTISNLTTESTRKAGLFGYAGAVTVNDLTLENVTVTGSQAGVFAGSGEGFTANNCFLKGTNTVNFTPTEETWNGIGAITGVLQNGTVNVTIDKDATVTLNRGDMTTAEGCVYVDDLTGHITTNKGTVTVEENWTVVATGSYPYSAAEDTVETQQDVADTVE